MSSEDSAQDTYLPCKARFPSKKRLCGGDGEGHQVEEKRGNKKQWAGGRLPTMPGKKVPCGPCRIGKTPKTPRRRKSQYVASVVQTVLMPDNTCTSYLPLPPGGT